LEKRAEQVLPRSKGGGGKMDGVEEGEEKWPKQCMHIRINEKTKTES
jgi:hypothetical protein